ncbi:MAG TPA: phosphotransferase [Nocardioides sp.]|uniref:phosphotransferase n=1 Tax=Nocardioides sp. TaxID=35761 RepID=UPI002E356846|nr:phosphotransferase [Nocardioides sp.]HEX3929392.1 phosphotransferase [Nocardioides sp.]
MSGANQPFERPGSPSTMPPTVELALQRLWPGAAWSSEPLEGGMTNRNFKVVLESGPEAGRAVVVQEQLPDALAGVVGIQRRTQSLALEEIASLGLTPPVLAQLADLGVLVVDFVDGSLLSDVADRAGALTMLGQTLARLHAQTRGTSVHGLVSDPFSGTTWLFEQVDRESPELVEDFGWTMHTLHRIGTARGSYVAPLLHADVSEGNVVFTADRAFLIDWEYAGSGDRFFDVGDFAEKAKLGPEEVAALVSGYGEAADERVLAAVRCYRFVSMLREGLWSLRAGTTGFLDFDHAGYARTCLARMAEIASEASFESDLALLEREEKLP